jgi:hypothetical protein
MVDNALDVELAVSPLVPNTKSVFGDSYYNMLHGSWCMEILYSEHKRHIFEFGDRPIRWVAPQLAS